MTPTEEFARLLDQLQLGTYDDTGVTGDVFLRRLPPEPGSAVAVTRYGSDESDSKQPYDEIRVQFRVRGPDAEDRAQAIYDALHGLERRDLPGGTHLMLCVGVQGGPIDIGADKLERDQYTVNMRAELHRPTANRP